MLFNPFRPPQKGLCVALDVRRMLGAARLCDGQCMHVESRQQAHHIGITALKVPSFPHAAMMIPAPFARSSRCSSLSGPMGSAAIFMSCGLVGRKAEQVPLRERQLAVDRQVVDSLVGRARVEAEEQSGQPARDAGARGLGADRRRVQGRGRSERPLGTSATKNAPGANGAGVEGIEVLDERDLGAAA